MPIADGNGRHGLMFRGRGGAATGRPVAYSLVDGALHLQFRGRRMAPTGYKAMRRGYFNNNINNMIQQHCARNNTARAQGDYYLTRIVDN